MSEPDRLLSVAAAIADGTSVSWAEESRRITDEDGTATLEALRQLERLLITVRRADRDEAVAPAPARDDHDAATAPLRWGHLLILDRIGRGAFATVYRARDERLQTDVALKLLSSPAPASRAQADRILQEARLLAKVDHRNVVRVYGVDDAADPVGLWMELVKGRNLTDQLRADGPFSALEASMIGRDVCRAMAAVHQAGILHGDIKTHNIMREAGGRIVLMDFGAGQAIDATHHPEASLVGTPVYLAPEVLKGQPRSAASDIYAIGVLLYHLATGSYPVVADSVKELIEAHERGERRHLRDARPDLPDDFVRAVEQASASEPAARFRSLGQLEDALVRVTSPAPPVSEQPAAPIPIPVPTQRRRWTFAAAAAAILLIAGVIALWLMSPGPAPKSIVPAGVLVADVAPTVAAAGAYNIEAAFFRAGPNGEEQVRTGTRVSPGDALFLTLQSSVPVYVYVVNEDEKGAAILEFPLPGDGLRNPLPAGQRIVVPRSVRWQIDSPGEQEHFLVFASPEPLGSLEEELLRLPAPRLGAPVRTAALPPVVAERLRSAGALTPAPVPDTAGGKAPLSKLFTQPLTDASEQVRGLWVRQLTLQNPGR